MIPVKLELSGFLSYRDPVEIDFTHFELACISGPNGAGKSSLLDAITFALFGQARKPDDAVINSQSEAADVSLTFKYEGNTYRVQRIKPRDKTTILEFQIQTTENKWKALTERTLRETEALIQKTLHLDYETFVNASFFLQGKADQFTKQRPSDRKRILSSILGLEIWESYKEGAAARRKELESEIGNIQGRLQEINSELGEEEGRKKHLGELDAQLARIGQTKAAQQALVESLLKQAAAVEQQAELVTLLASQLQHSQNQSAETQQRLREIRAEVRENVSLLERADQIESAYSDWQKLRSELAKWEDVAATFNKEEKKRIGPLTTIETEKARLETELQNLKTTAVQVESSLPERERLTNQAKTLETQIKKLETMAKSLPELEKRVDTGEKARTKAIAENSLLFTQMKELEKRRDLVKTAVGAYCPTCGQALTEEHRTQAVTSLNKEGEEKSKQWRANKKAFDKQEIDLANLKSKLEKTKEADASLRTLTRQADQVKLTLEELNKLTAIWETERAPRLKGLELILAAGDFADEARRQLTEIDAELKATGYDAARHDAVRASELAARASENDMRGLEKARAAAKPLEREIKNIEKMLSDQEKELANNQAAHQQAAEALAARQAGLPDIQQAESHLLELQDHENRLRQEVGAAQQLVAVLDKQRLNKKDFEAQREDLASQVTQYQSLERAFGKDGVPAMLIEQALPEIEIKANEILDRLSDGNLRVTFVTQQAFKDKKRGDELRETLEIQISDGAGTRDYEMFSGGEAFRIDFAIRLALSEVLTQRAGARLQTLVIDEGFGSQDEAGRQRLVEAISSVREDFAKILVITHIDTLKDAFPNRIEVMKGPQGSTVQVI